MPLRTISSNLLAALQSEVAVLAMCVKLTRTDGTVMGFTTYDHNIILANGDGTFQNYDPSNSFEPTAIRQEASEGVDNVEIAGILKSSAITDADIRAGKYDGASIQFMLMNPRSANDGVVYLTTGTIGEVTFRDSSFSVEIRSLTQALTQQIGDLFSPTCRVKQLGDSQCKIVLAPFQFARTIAVIDSIYQIEVVDASVTGYYTYGRVIPVTGANSGLNISREIKSHTFAAGNAVILLQEAFPYAFTVGDSITLEAGCDRQVSTCINRFANLVNFRGEPFIPGTDKLLHWGRK